jgi:uncharacterized membrane protein YqiK
VSVIVVAVLAFVVAVASLAGLVAVRSVHRIGPNQVGLVTKRFALRKLAEGNPVAFSGEAGYQAELLMPGLRLRAWPRFSVRKFPWVQVPAGQIGAVTALEGEPLPAGDIASRLGGFADVARMEAIAETADAELIDVLLGSKNELHNNYQDFQAFLEAGGRFVFTIDLQVQIHVSDTRAPKVISMVGTMQNLVNEVLQSAVGNHFRNALQSLAAIRFIETREDVQRTALEAIAHYLSGYQVETKGVYVQDVRLTGAAEADKIRAVGLAEAKAAGALGLARAVGFRAQGEAIGELPTALVAVAGAVAEGGINVVPEVLVAGNGSSIDGLAGALMRKVREQPVKASADGKEAVAAASR